MAEVRDTQLPSARMHLHDVLLSLHKDKLIIQGLLIGKTKRGGSFRLELPAGMHPRVECFETDHSIGAICTRFTRSSTP